MRMMSSQHYEPEAGLPRALLPAIAAVFLFGGIGPNWVLAAFSVIVLGIGCLLLWRPGEPPILLFVFVFQWLQGSVAIFYANWQGLTVQDASPFVGADLEQAILLSLIALVMLAVGLTIGAGRSAAGAQLAARRVALAHPIQRWFGLYVQVWLAATVLLSFAWVVPGLSQIAIAIANLKWAFFLMLGYATFLQPQKSGNYFLFVFVGEFVLSIAGFLSEFRIVFVLTLIAMVMAGARLSRRQLAGIIVLVVVLVGLGVGWSAVKSPFRGFLGSGTDDQPVTYQMALFKIFELVENLDLAGWQAGADSLLLRLSYVEYFGVVLNYVPHHTPHEDGAILWDAVSRPFMPRLFFPDKAVIDDTQRTLLYTGFSGEGSETTSISLGHIAEAYIDFGVYGMMLSVLGLSYFYGRIYRFLLGWSQTFGLLGMSLATGILYTTGAMESSLTKIFGGVAVSFLAAVLVVLYIVPNYCPWIREERSR